MVAPRTSSESHGIKKAPSQRGLSLKATGGVSKVGRRNSWIATCEDVPSQVHSKVLERPTFDTPTTASPSPSLYEGGYGISNAQQQTVEASHLLI